MSLLPAKAAAKQRRLENHLTAAVVSSDRDRDSIDRFPLAESETAKFLIEDPRLANQLQLSKDDLIKLGSPAHAAFHANTIDNSDIALKEKPVRIEILEPDVKEILATCALYNLDQVRTKVDIFGQGYR